MSSTDLVLDYRAKKEECGSLNAGRLKLTTSHVTFKSQKTGRVETISVNDIETIHWQRLATQYAIRVMTKSGQVYRYGGLEDSEENTFKNFVSKHYKLEMETLEFSLKGFNWGSSNFDGSALSFDIKRAGKAFEIPLSNVSHCTPAKNEVTLEFHQNDDAPVSLMEMRFHLPTVDGVDPTQVFIEHVLAKASIIQATGEAIAEFKELQCLTPRGRYDIKIFPSFIQLHGKTFDYKIPLSSVLRLFQLPHKDGRQMYFVIAMDPPIRQGQTRYPFLILQFNKEEELQFELGLTEEEIKDKYDGKLKTEMNGPVYESLGKIMRVLTSRKVFMPDSSFGKAKDVPVITCSYRASSGFLYPLERGFIYVHKPPLHIRFDEILSVNFARSGGSITRSFDFEVETKSGIIHTFSSIEKGEYGSLFAYIETKNLRIKNRGTEGDGKERDDDLVDSDADEPDAYMHRVKEEGRIRQEGGDSDESDVSFNPENEEEDVAEEFDSNASYNSSSDEDGEEGGEGKSKEKKRKREKEKKPRKERSEGKSKKKKKEKDEDKPKRPQTAFFIWMNENRESLKKKHPELSMTEFSKKCGEIWREMTADQKSKYEKMNAEAKKQYDKDMADYVPKDKPKQKSKEKESKSSKKDKPKSSSESKKSPTKSPSKSGSQQFKSREYIDDSDSSSSDDDKKKKKEKEKKKKAPAKASDKGKEKKKKGSSSEDEDKSDLDDEEEILSTPTASEEDSD